MQWPVTITATATEVDSLFWFVLLVVGVWLAACELYLLACLWRFRQGRAQAAAAPSLALRGTPIVLVLGTGVLLCDFAIEAASLPVWRKMKETSSAGDLEVHALARQFSWRFVYPGKDRVFGSRDDLSLENELHVPLGAEVRLQLRSQDVVHSFFVPAARLKQDVVPGRESAVWFRPDRLGRFEIACAELCGFAHYTMRAYLYVHTADDYERWLEQEGTDGAKFAVRSQ